MIYDMRVPELRPPCEMRVFVDGVEFPYVIRVDSDEGVVEYHSPVDIALGIAPANRRLHTVYGRVTLERIN